MEQGDFRFHLFVSFTGMADALLARELERLLESFHEAIATREPSLTPLCVCVDSSDFRLPPAAGPFHGDTGSQALIRGHLEQANELLVLCSEGAARSHWVEQEIRWFLEHRGPDRIHLALTEGAEPCKEPERYFSKPLIELNLHKKTAYDLRKYREDYSAKVELPEFTREIVRLGCDLTGLSLVEVYPAWLEGELRRARRRIAAMASRSCFEQFLGDPLRAVLVAFAANETRPGPIAANALREACVAAVMHHRDARHALPAGNRGSEAGAAMRRGRCFSTMSPDGRFRLMVIPNDPETGDPRTDVYVLANERSGITRLSSPAESEAGVDCAVFDGASRHVVVVRGLELLVYRAEGRLVSAQRLPFTSAGCVTHVNAYFAGRYILVAAGGELWLADGTAERMGMGVDGLIDVPDERIVDTRISPDGLRAVVLFASGRAGLLTLDEDGHPQLRELGAGDARCALFPGGRSDLLVLAGRDGYFAAYELGAHWEHEVFESRVTTATLERVSFDPETARYALLDSNGRIHMAHPIDGRVTATLDTDGARGVTDPSRVLAAMPKPE